MNGAGPHPLGRAEIHRNFACLVWMGSVFAMGWAEVMVVLQPMLVGFGASNTQIGIVQGTLIAALPGMVVAPWVTRRFARKKALVFAMDCLYLLPLGIIGAAVWSGAVSGGSAAVWMVVILMAAGQVAAGFGGLPNQEFFAACIPMVLRGRLAGVSASLGGVLGMAGAALAAWILAVLPSPQGYGALLFIAWAMCMAADSAVLFAKEPPTPVERSPHPYSRAMWSALWSDKAFLRVAGLCCLFAPLMGQLPVFASVFAFRDLGFTPKMAAWITMASSASRVVLSPAAGWLTDRWGAKRALLLWPAISCAGFVALAAWPSMATILAVSGIASVAWGGFSGAMNALTCGIPKPENRAGHFTILSLGMVASNSVAPLAAGLMFDALPFRTGFLVLGALLFAVCLCGAISLRNLSADARDYC